MAAATEKEHLYHVSLGPLIGLTIPPDHPDFRRAVIANVRDYLIHILQDDDDWDRQIDSYTLLAVDGADVSDPVLAPWEHGDITPARSAGEGRGPRA